MTSTASNPGKLLNAQNVSSSFGDAWTLRSRRLGHPLCVGLDPHLEHLPALFRQGSMAPKDPATAEAVETFLRAVIERVASRVAIVKPQIAFFEQLGWRGLRVLETLIQTANDLGLMVLVDAKRGDIGSTATAYAQAFLSADAPFAGQALTVNPYLGKDSLAPFLAAADAAGGGLFVLVKTSNPGASDLQDRTFSSADGKASRTLSSAVAELLAPLASARRGPETGWSNVGAVVGATWPGDAESLREQLPHSLFLVPGYGAQGGSAREAVRGFVRGPSGRLEGGLVNSSRGILFPEQADTADLKTWQRAIDEALDRSINELGEAVA